MLILQVVGYPGDQSGRGDRRQLSRHRPGAAGHALQHGGGRRCCCCSARFSSATASRSRGKSGTVQNLNLFFTELAGGDHVQILIPNGQVWGQAMINNSVYGTRRVALKLPVPFAKNPDAIAARIKGFLESDQRVQKSSVVVIQHHRRAAVELSVEAWATTGEAGESAHRPDAARARRSLQAHRSAAARTRQRA